MIGTGIAAAVGRMRFAMLLCASVGVLLSAAACKAQTPDAGAASRSMSQYGAVGDGRADDSRAVQQALSAAGACLDGGGRSYRIVGTLTVPHSLCLRNATLIQSLPPQDVASYVARACPRIVDAEALVDCGDQAIAEADVGRVYASLAVRTLLIRAPEGAAPIRVTLENVTIDRGRFPEAGSRTDSAGIWLEGADGVAFRNVTITGHGKGFGLYLARSRNVTLDGLWLHDMSWAPYRGELPVSLARLGADGWNSWPIHEFRSTGQQGAGSTKFYGVRVQEQLTCAYLADVDVVRIRNLRIERCLARIGGRDIAWQTDGLTIASRAADVRIEGARIRSTWEGIDVAGSGAGVDLLTLDDVEVDDSFAIAVKLGYRVSRARLSNLRLRRAGLAGIMMSGPVEDVQIATATIEGIGRIDAADTLPDAWASGSRAGVRIGSGSAGRSGRSEAPRNILIEDVEIDGGDVPRYEFGVLNQGGTGVRLSRVTARGFGRANLLETGPER